MFDRLSRPPAREALIELRHAVGAHWQARLSETALSDQKYPTSLPGYFVDRLTFRAATRRPAISAAEFGLGEAPVDADDRLTQLRRFLQPSVQLAGWKAEPLEPTDLSPFYDELRTLWASFAHAQGLPTLPDASRARWLDVFDDSVFYPGRPAIPGPIFWDAIADSDRTEAVDRFGARCAIDFYCFIQQVHEQIHRAQTGEPLFNEVVQAALWVSFLDLHPELWILQRNSTTGEPCVREHEFVTRLPTLAAAAIDAQLDSASIAAAFDPLDRRRRYGATCRLAARFDAGEIRYATYLSRFAHALSA